MHPRSDAKIQLQMYLSFFLRSQHPGLSCHFVSGNRSSNLVIFAPAAGCPVYGFASGASGTRPPYSAAVGIWIPVEPVLVVPVLLSSKSVLGRNRPEPSAVFATIQRKYNVDKTNLLRLIWPSGAPEQTCSEAMRPSTPRGCSQDLPDS